MTCKLFIPACLTILLCACNSSSKRTKPIEPPAPPPPATIEPITANSALQLDFTLPLSALDIDADKLVGATFDEFKGEFAILGEQGELVFMSGEGVISTQILIDRQGDFSFSGIEFVDADSYVLSTSDSKLLMFDAQANTLEDLAQLDFDIHAVAYDQLTGSAVVVKDGDGSKIIRVSQTGDVTEVSLESDVVENSVTGLTITEDTLVMASNDVDQQSLIISAAMSGAIGTVWSIDTTTTTGLVLLDPAAPEIMTTNSDPDLTLTLFESPRPASIPSDEVLSVDVTLEIEFDQPSGIDFSPESSTLYYVTDFGEVRRGLADGSNQLLFELDAMQGSFEAIVHNHQDNTLTLLMSDEADQDSFILTFDMQGNELSRFILPITEESHKFEGLDYDSNNDTYMVMTTAEGPKTLYLVQDGTTTTTALPDSYNDFVITGIALSGNGEHLYFVTEEWEDDTDTLNAGLLIRLDMATMTELSRHAIAVEIDGVMQGVTDPSDVAIDEINDLVYITSDTDDAILYVYNRD